MAGVAEESIIYTHVTLRAPSHPLAGFPFITFTSTPHAFLPIIIPAYTFKTSLFLRSYPFACMSKHARVHTLRNHPHPPSSPPPRLLFPFFLAAP